MAEFVQQLPGAPVPPLSQATTKEMPNIFQAAADLATGVGNVLSDRRESRIKAEKAARDLRIETAEDSLAGIYIKDLAERERQLSTPTVDVTTSAPVQASLGRIEDIQNAEQNGQIRPAAARLQRTNEIVALIEEFPEASSEILELMQTRGIDDFYLRAALDEQRQLDRQFEDRLNAESDYVSAYDNFGQTQMLEDGTSRVVGLDPNVSREEKIRVGRSLRQTETALRLATENAQAELAEAQAAEAEGEALSRRTSESLMSAIVEDAQNNIVPVLNNLITLTASDPTPESQAAFREAATFTLNQVRVYRNNVTTAALTNGMRPEERQELDEYFDTLETTLTNVFTGDLSAAKNITANIQALKDAYNLEFYQTFPGAARLLSLPGGEELLADMVRISGLPIAQDILPNISAYIAGGSGTAAQRGARAVANLQAISQTGQLPSDPEEIIEAISMSAGTLQNQIDALSDPEGPATDDTLNVYANKITTIGVFATDLPAQSMPTDEALGIISLITQPKNLIALENLSQAMPERGALAYKTSLNAVTNAQRALFNSAQREAKGFFGEGNLEVKFNSDTNQFELLGDTAQGDRSPYGFYASIRMGDSRISAKAQQLQSYVTQLNASLDFIEANVDKAGLPEGLLTPLEVRKYIATQELPQGLYPETQREGASVPTRVTQQDVLSSIRSDAEQLNPLLGWRTNLQSVIDQKENSGTQDYRTLFGDSHLDEFSDVNVLDMTIGELFQWGRGDYGDYVKQVRGTEELATPIGRYQIVGDTMMFAAQGLGLDPSTTKFSPQIQDLMFDYLVSDGLTKQNNPYHHWGLNPDGTAKANEASN